MRALIVVDVEIEEGRRPGTPYARLEWVARSVARFVGNQRRVRGLHNVTVHRANPEVALPSEGLIDIPLEVPAGGSGDAR